MAIDLLVGVVDHVIAFSRRSGAEPERIEIWTLRDGKAVHYRGYPLDEGLAVLTETTRSRKLEVACRALLAFNRGDRGGDVRVFAEQLPGQRLDDVEVLGETFESLVVSALHHHDEATSAPVHLVDHVRERASRSASSPTPRPRRRWRRPRAGTRSNRPVGERLVGAARLAPQRRARAAASVGASIPATTGRTSRDGREAPRASDTFVLLRG